MFIQCRPGMFVAGTRPNGSRKVDRRFWIRHKPGAGSPQGHRSVAIQRQLQFARIDGQHFGRRRAWRRRRYHHHGRHAPINRKGQALDQFLVRHHLVTAGRQRSADVFQQKRRSEDDCFPPGPRCHQNLTVTRVPRPLSPGRILQLSANLLHERLHDFHSQPFAVQWRETGRQARPVIDDRQRTIGRR